MFAWFRKLRRYRLKRRPFPESWIPILENRVPFYQHYAAGDQKRFRELLKVFAWEKHFIGAKGFEMTDEVQVVISACAVRLIRFLDLSYFDRLTEIVVYPYVYRHPGEQNPIMGEAHRWGTVVLSWPAVIHGIENPDDGQDTALHEFAHVLDIHDGAFDGTPELASREDYAPWARILSRHFLNLQKRRPNERRVLRMYGATNEAEFFAVATESFFEKPKKMKKLTPLLYEELMYFYRWDPVVAAPFPQTPSGSISPDDACPCGSTKRVTRCCGR